MRLILPPALFIALFIAHSTTSHAGLTPGFAGSLSALPGLGQTVEGRPVEGVTWFASVVGALFHPNPQVKQIGFDLWMYNMYDAYRDAGPTLKANHNLLENYAAFANPLNLVDPIGAPVVGYAAVGGAKNQYPALRSPATVLTYGFVGLGEEALFRGFLFPSFSQIFSSRSVGAITSSAVFSLSHATGGASELQASPIIQRFIGGLIFCWQVDRNRYDLRKNIFAHAWYDVLIDQGGQIRGAQLKLPLP